MNSHPLILLNLKVLLNTPFAWPNLMKKIRWENPWALSGISLEWLVGTSRIEILWSRGVIVCDTRDELELDVGISLQKLFN